MRAFYSIASVAIGLGILWGSVALLAPGNDDLGDGSPVPFGQGGEESFSAGVASKAPLRFNPSEGDQIAYRFNQDSEGEIASSFLREAAGSESRKDSASSALIATESEGILCLKYYEAGAETFNVAARVSGFRYLINQKEPNYADEVASDFSFRMNKRGELRGLHFSRGVESLARTYLRDFVSSVQVTLAEQSEPIWQERETDAHGAYTASYEAEWTDRGTIVRKEKSEYNMAPLVKTDGALALMMSMELEVLESSSSALVSDDSAWFLEAEADGLFAQKSGGGEVSRWTQSLRMRQVTSTECGQFPRTFEAFSEEMNSADYAMRGTYRADPVMDVLSSRLDMQAALETFLDVYAECGDAYACNSDRFMVSYLRRNPDASRELIAALDANEENWDDDVLLSLFSTLSEAGHLEAQMALVGAASNEDYRMSTRTRALAYLGDIKVPARLLIEELGQLYSEGDGGRPPDGQQDLKGMSVLALGALGYRGKSNAQLRSNIGKRLTEGLDSADNDWDRRMVLAGIGNYGGDKMLPMVDPYLDDPDEEVRAAAYGALRRMTGEVAVRTGWARYGEEPSSKVRGKALQALVKMPATEVSIELATVELGVADPDEQLVIVDYLGRSLREHPGNDLLLRRLLKTNPPFQVKRAIYRYIPPLPLRSG